MICFAVGSAESSKTEDVRIQLIPALENPVGCGKISDLGLREHCRQLNTYGNAFHQMDEALCRQVDQGPGTKMCLESVPVYIANPELFSR